MDVNILGSKWKILYNTLSQNPDLEGKEGYCDMTSRTIYIRRYEEGDRDIDVFEVKMDNRSVVDVAVLRHELIHAFLSESGLGSECYWAKDEEVIDWFALQFPKLRDAFSQVYADGFDGGLPGRRSTAAGRRKHVFVCTPYWPDQDRISEIILPRDCCELEYARGNLPIAPRAYFPKFLCYSDETHRNDAMDMGIQLLRFCDEMHVFREPFGEMTSEMREEIEHAKLMGIPIKYYDLSGKEIAAA